MREPTPASTLYALWRHLAYGEPTDGDTGLHEGEAYCGYFQFREVKGGPWVPLRVFCQREIDEFGQLASDEVFKAQIRDEPPFPAERVCSHLGRPITRERYNALMADDSPRMRASKVRVDLTTKPTRPR